jgi:hypothetical protein
MIRFAGVNLLLDAYGEAATRCERTGLDRARLFPGPTIVRTADRSGSVGDTQPATPLPRPNYPESPPLKPNQLHWPTGAARFATFVAILDREQLVKVLKQFNKRGDLRYLRPQQLVIGDSEFDGTISPDAVSTDAEGRSVLSVGMTPLEPQPVAIIDQTVQIDRTDPDPDLWLLPLVDARYFWQWASLPARIPESLLDSDASVPETSTTIKETWNGWLRIIRYSLDSRAAMFGELDEDPPPPDPNIVQGVTIGGSTNTVTGSGQAVVRIYLDPDPIDEDAWFYPDRVELDRPHHNAAEILDALAHSCGRRVVRDWSGHLRLIDPESSLNRHQINLEQRTIVAGGIRLLPHSSEAELKQKLKIDAIAKLPFHHQTTAPEVIDIVFRKLCEYDDADLPADVTEQADMPSDYPWSQALHGPGTRTLRALTEKLGAFNIVPGSARKIFVSSWVGRQWYAFDDSHETEEIIIDDGTCDGDPDEIDREWHLDRINRSDTHANQAAGLIDDEFYGDRYFRFAKAAADNYLEWVQQRHAYCFAGFVAWNQTGFDDHVLIDAGTGKTFVHSVGPEFGVDTMLVQLHRQGAFSQDRIVGLITSQWTLHPKELERLDDPAVDFCDLQTEEGIWKELPIRIDCLITDRFDHSWQWAEITLRPLIPADPWAPTNSLEYGRSRVWAGSPITAVSRSRKIIDRLRTELLCDTLPTADAPDDCPSVMSSDREDCFYFDRTASLSITSGVLYALKWGDEWQVIEGDCIPEGVA